MIRTVIIFITLTISSLFAEDVFMILDKPLKQIFPAVKDEIGLYLSINYVVKDASNVQNAEIIGDADSLFKERIPFRIEDGSGQPVKGSSDGVVIVKMIDENGKRYLVKFSN